MVCQTKWILWGPNVNIHHSYPTLDSREGNLAIFSLMTDKCQCVKYYSGTEVRLFRVSAARINYKKGEEIHFVSVDMLNQYFDFQTMANAKYDDASRSLRAIITKMKKWRITPENCMNRVFFPLCCTVLKLVGDIGIPIY